MKVVSNTSPLNYLAVIDFVDLLPRLFSRVIIPLAVRQELEAPGAPEQALRLVQNKPEWLEVVSSPPIANARLWDLDPGEREAIAVALEIKADLVLLDEARGRGIGGKLGLRITGTLGLLDRALRDGLDGAPEALARLRLTNFRASPRLYELVLRSMATRRESESDAPQTNRE
ncbi:MAG: DUF3368 domain-containing protein [Bryobacteraceae bacterium]